MARRPQRLAEEARLAEYMSAVPDEVVAAVQKVFEDMFIVRVLQHLPDR